MQRRDFSRHIAGTGLGLAMAGLARAQGAPKEGTQYVRLATAAPVTLDAPDKKIEVVEFFWFGCPHCFAFEPLLESWVKKLPADVSFRQVPVGFMAPHQYHQRLFYALEETGLLASMRAKVFAAIHQQYKRLNTDSEIVALANANGADGAKLVAAMKSFSVNTKANRARQLADAYKIDGVPALGIQGRYYTSGALAGSHERALGVADYLIQLSRTKA
jgi:protein dithiol oxidoreductase (disulfide-forming)